MIVPDAKRPAGQPTICFKQTNVRRVSICVQLFLLGLWLYLDKSRTVYRSHKSSEMLQPLIQARSFRLCLRKDTQKDVFSGHCRRACLCDNLGGSSCVQSIAQKRHFLVAALPPRLDNSNKLFSALLNAGLI